ncbi:tenecin-3-like [Tribolium madens]|uniref:tenecin-3-like n=1 Tax=Tribolium madens TaxID=41895 RepID=UPI001CF73D6F|nr:tenecin-3-like [Tribolium madens]
MKTLVICLILLVAVSAAPRPDHHTGHGVGESAHHGSSGSHQGGLIGGGTHDYGTHGTHQGGHQGSHQGGLIGGGTHDQGTHGGHH